MMSRPTTTAQRKPSRLKVILRAVWFAILLLISFYLHWLLATENYTWSDAGNKVITVNYELNWLHNFSDVPGVRGYAQELLKKDLPGYTSSIIEGALFYWIPFMLACIGIYAGITRRITALQYRIVAYGLIALLLFLIGAPNY
jgi:hypothetical protein